jgi:phage repressor protein C with HTH and peptisase S24 domain
MNLLSERIKLAIQLKEGRDGSEVIQADLARAAGSSDASVNYWLSDTNGISAKKARLLASYLGVDSMWLETGKGTPEIKDDAVTDALQTEWGEVGYVEYWDIRGSCGGGVMTFDQIPKGRLIKEGSFFKKYSLKPDNAFAIYADGDSMAEFIIDGDMCIFDRSKTDPVSGKIFAIQHPDGLRIKVLRRSIDGTWALESKNQDKRRYPDEVIPPSHADLLKIVGQFVYRQGG